MKVGREVRGPRIVIRGVGTVTTFAGKLPLVHTDIADLRKLAASLKAKDGNEQECHVKND